MSRDRLLWVSYSWASDSQSGFGDCCVVNMRAPRSGEDVDALRGKIAAAQDRKPASIVLLNWKQIEAQNG